MPESVSLDTNSRGKYVKLYVHSVWHATDDSYRSREASQEWRQRRSWRWAAGNVYARHGTSAVLIAVLCSFILPETTFLRPALTHSRVLGAELDASASGQPRMHADYTEPFGWNRCASLVVPYVQRFTLVRSVQRPAKRSRRVQLENRRFLALRGRRAHATAPTAGRRGAPSRKSMCSTDRARCIRCAWRLGRAGPPRPKRDFT